MNLREIMYTLSSDGNAEKSIADEIFIEILQKNFLKTVDIRCAFDIIKKSLKTPCSGT